MGGGSASSAAVGAGGCATPSATSTVSGQTCNASAGSWLTISTVAPDFDPHAPYEATPRSSATASPHSPYDGDIAFADVQIERLLQHLKDAGRYDDTLIIVVGDHGEGFGDHDELEHGFLLYNSTLRVPLIFSSPRAPRAGTRVATPVSLVDLMPTVLDCLRYSVGPHIPAGQHEAALHRQGIT